MEFRIDRTAFAEAVGRAVRALPARTPVPVLGGLLLEADAGRLAVTGFDFEAAVRVEAEAEIPVPGRVLVLGRRLLEVCRVLPDGPVSCVLEASRFTVEADGTRFGLSTLPLAEYPALPAAPAPYGTVDAAAFATAVAQVAVAAGRDDTLPLLTGVQLRLDGGEMTLSASDRYRYAVRRLEWKPEAAADGVVEALLPSRRLLDVARSPVRGGDVLIGWDPAGGGLIGFECGRRGRHCGFWTGGCRLTSRCSTWRGRRSPRWSARGSRRPCGGSRWWRRRTVRCGWTSRPRGP